MIALLQTGRTFLLVTLPTGLKNLDLLGEEERKNQQQQQQQEEVRKHMDTKYLPGEPSHHRTLLNISNSLQI